MTMEPRFLASQKQNQRGAGGSPPTITSITPNTWVHGSPASPVIVGTGFTTVAAVSGTVILDANHSNNPTSFFDSNVISDTEIDCTYDGSELDGAQVTVVMVTNSFGSATKAITIT